MGIAMSDTSEIWELRRGDVLVGTLTITDQDSPWYSARFERTEAYAPYDAVFVEGNDVRSGDDQAAWSQWRQQIQNLELRLVRLHEQAVASEFLLYIEGSEADFRPYLDV